MNTKIDYDKLINTLSLMSTEDKKEHINSLTTVEIKKYVEPLILHHSEEKLKAKNTTEFMKAITKEHAMYVHIHEDHGMAIYALDKSNGDMKLSLAASRANDLHNIGGIDHVQKAIDHAIDYNIKTDNQIFNDLKNSAGNIKIFSEDLHIECTNHHIDQVNNHITDLGQNRDVFIDQYKFSNTSEYLHHIKDHNHHFVPIDHINTHLHHIEHQHAQEMQRAININHNRDKEAPAEHEQELQKELHMNNGRGGFSL